MNPTEGKLTEAEIENFRGGDWMNPYRRRDDLVNTLCDMALESLKAPAVTTGKRPTHYRCGCPIPKEMTFGGFRHEGNEIICNRCGGKR